MNSRRPVWAARVYPPALAVILLAAVALLAGQKLVSDRPIFVTWFEPTVNGVAFGLLATLVVRRRPDSRMGWLFASLGGLAAVQLLAGEYAVFARAVHPLPAAPAVALLPALLTAWILPLVVLVMLVYPEGQALSPAWRPLVWLIVACGVADMAASMVRPGAYADLPGYTNPLGVARLHPLVAANDRWTAWIELGVAVIAIVGLIARFRRAGGVVRAQLKWFALAVGLFVTSAVVVVAGASRLPEWTPHVAFGLSVAGFAAATGVAILRHPLYEIDRVISRAVSYVLITGSLIIVYVILVAGVTRLLPVSSSLAVAMSTLVVATLFQPLRRRLQSAVDRRFNRARYDTARTIEAFSIRLRDEVDLDSLRSDLIAVVHGTVQPTSAGLWLRGFR